MGISLEFVFIEEIECFWFELQCEMMEFGNVVKFNYFVIDVIGQEKEFEVICVGIFNLVVDGKYLKYDSDIGKIVELICQFFVCFVEIVEVMINVVFG